MWALRPAKPLGVLSRHPCRNPKPLPRGEGLCMLCWLCIVQSLWAYTPGILAGAECGAAALTPLGATPQTPFLSTIEVLDRLQAVRHKPYRPHIYCFLIVIQRTMCVYPCFTQILPVTVITAVPGVIETVPSVFVAKVAAGTSIAPAVVSNTPVASL